MKKAIFSGLLALGLALTSQQEAKAWVNFKFSAGVNWQWQSGNNCLLWGAARGGQVPGPEAFGGYGHPGMAPAFPYFGAAPSGPVGPDASAPTSAPAPAPMQQTLWYGGNPYTTVGYNPYSYETTPTYYYPSYYYYAPSYWYGR